ncbi:hypothetical protein OROHE_007636 [Orobanche hederae]
MGDEKWQCCSFSQPTEWLKGSVIGSGSYGTVRLAVNSTTGALFVVKSAKSEAGIKSLENEAHILEKLNSPHIVKCIGRDIASTKDGETIYSLFFEYVAAGSLSDVARKFGGKLNEKVIRLYTREILGGLKYLHEKGIVHSDIKCKNVLLGTQGVVKLADFGCARILRGGISENSSKSCNRTIGGTPLWMAPEVLRNEGISPTADIWSLGCTVIEMATGRPPWDGYGSSNDPMGAMLKIAKGHDVPEFPGGFSGEGLDFLRRCLERDPRKRWTSEKLLDHPFVKGRFMECVRKVDVVVSPTSVLDAASYVSDDDDDDDDNDLCDDILGRISISDKCWFQENELVPENASEKVSEGSNDWITVRSR